MKTRLRHLALVTCALACGTAVLWNCQDTGKPLSEPVESGVETPRASLAVEPGSLKARSDERAPDQAHQTADDAAPALQPESIPAEDSEAALAVLDQLARDVANGRDPEEVFEALSADFPAAMRDAAVRIFAGQGTASFASFHALPPSFLDGLAAVLRKQVDQNGLASALDAAWRDSSDPVVRQRLESLEIPGLYAARVAELALAGDNSEALIYLARLETCSHPRTPDYFAALAAEPGIDLKELRAAALNWANHFPDVANPSDLGRVSDPVFSSGERSMVVPALAGAAPGHPAQASFPSPKMPPTNLRPMHIYDGQQQTESTSFEPIPPSYEAEGKPNSLSSIPDFTDQPKPGSAQLPQQGVYAASGDLAPDPRGPTVSATDTVGAWRLLAQLAVHDTNAAELLVKGASKAEIPYLAWPAIADTLGGESLQDGQLIRVASATSAWTDEEVSDRLDLIGALLEVTANKVVRHALQEAVVRLLSNQLSPTAPRRR